MRRLLIAAALALAAAVTAVAYADEEPVNLSANEIVHDRARNVVTARGDVRIVQGERTLFAEEISYDSGADRLIGKGSVMLMEPNGDVMFADDVVLTDGMKAGVVNELKAQLAGGARMSARAARRENSRRTILDKATYTRCEACPDNPDRAPVWRVKADKVTRDLDDLTVKYKNAMIEFFGIPVIYTPYFSHPDPSVKRKTGILPPTYGGSSELGLNITLPVYFVLDEQSDATLYPRLTTEDGMIMGGEFRRYFKGGRWETEGSITHVDRRDANNRRIKGKDWRGHLRSTGEARLSDKTRLGFDLYRASDDSFLRRYDYDQSSTLTSYIDVQSFDGREYMSAEFFSFQGLRASDRQDEIPIVLPLLNYRRSFTAPGVGGRLDVGGNAVALQRVDGRDVKRLSLKTDWSRPYIDAVGGVSSLNLGLRADGYAISDAQSTNPSARRDNFTSGRFWPQASLDWRLPLIRPGERTNQLLEPQAQLVLAPGGGNSNEIPNEDSQSFEFSYANLFSANRFHGHDRVDSGSRLNYGVTLGLHGHGGGWAELSVGQSLRLREQPPLVGLTGLESRFSDLVGRFSLNTGKRLRYTLRYRLAPDDFTFDRHEHELVYSGDRFSLQGEYLSLGSVIDGVARGNTEEMYLAGDLKITDYWSAASNFRTNLSGGGAIRLEGSLKYLDECFRLDIGIVRDYTSNLGTKPSTAIFVRYRLLGLN